MVSDRTRGGARPGLWAVLSATTMLTAVAPALGQTVAANDTSGTGVETIIVTAQKRAEDIQKVSLSIQALSTQKLEDLHISDFNDYAKFFPSLSFTTGGAGGNINGPGIVNISMRGITSGNDGNPAGPLPTVGVYLDEQPITTIGGTLNMHIYDIDRVEVLYGPQGTLYGASSEAGTVRIITNKPDPSGFSAAYDVQGNTVAHGSEGYMAEGYVNVPIADNAAIRLVAWDEHDSGYIDNVRATRTYPANPNVGAPGYTINDYPFVKKAFNSVDTYGARAALKIDLDDNWTITPSLAAQLQNNYGVFGYVPSIGTLKVEHFGPDYVHQNWYQAALTIEGKVGDLDLTYSGGHMDWWDRSRLDYSDYSYWYDKLYPSSFPQYYVDNNGTPIDPTQYILGADHYTKDSHELRIASPSTDRLRFVTGLFYERQSHWILQNYQIAGLGTQVSVPGWSNTWWLTDQERVDQDMAAFGEVSYDVTPQLTVTGGLRLYSYLNRLKGFFGFGPGSVFGSGTGVTQCFMPGDVHGDPCTDLDARAAGTGNTHKINVTYHIDDDRMVYFTWSSGFRPGGINRNSAFGAYSPDKLVNFEVGWKTTWLEDTLRINGALFHEDWNNMQFPFLGANSLTVVQNAGNAVSQGVEADFEWRPISALTISGSGSVTDANLKSNYCGFSNPVNNEPITGNCLAQDGYAPEAPSNTQLPVTPKWKGNLTARYNFPLAGFLAHIQGSVEGQSSSWTDLRVQAPLNGSLVPIRTALGKDSGYATVDLTTGIETDRWSLEFFVENAFNALAPQYRYAECKTQVCDPETYIVPSRPRLIGIKFGQNF